MWKWLGFVFGLLNILLVVGVLLFSGEVLRNPILTEFGSLYFLMAVVISWILLLVLCGFEEPRITRGIGWICGGMIFLSTLSYFLVMALQPGQGFSWSLFIESSIAGFAVFGVPLGVNILLLLLPLRLRKA